MSAIYSRRILYLYTPDTQTTNRSPAYFADYEQFLLNFNPDTITWRDAILAQHPAAQMWIYFQSHGVRDFDLDYPNPPGTPAALLTRPLNNNALFNYGDVQRMRDNAFPGHPNSKDWVLLDDNGDYFYGDNGLTLVLDPGDESWRQFLKDAALGLMQAQGWPTGLFLDNTNAYSGTFTALRKDTQVYGHYKSPAWINIMADFCAFMTAACHAAGKLCGGNVQAESYADFVQVAATLDYVMIEFFAFTSNGGYRPAAEWLLDIEKAEFLGANGIGSWLISHLNDALILAENSAELAKLQFHLASVLLIMAPNTSYRGHGSYGKAHYFSQYQAIDNLGGPLTDRYEVSDGVWRRDFQNGYVQVNPTAPASTISYTAAGAYHPATYAPLVANMIDRTDTVGDEIRLQIHAQSLDDGVLSYAAAGLPPGLALNTATGLISGKLTPTSLSYQYTPLITVTNTNGAGSVPATTSFTWWVKPGSVIARTNCGGVAKNAIDAATHWTIDQNSSSAYRDPITDGSNASNGPTTRGQSVPSWWPLSVLEEYRFNANGDSVYIIPAGTSSPVVVNVGFRANTTRQFDLLLQGAPVLTAFNPFTEYGQDGSGVKPFVATPDANQNITLRLTKGANSAPNTPQIAGIELMTYPQALPPTLQPLSDQTAHNSQSVNIPLTVQDWNGDGVVVTAQGLPAGLSIVDNASIQGVLAANASQGSPYDVTLTATDTQDETLSAQVMFTLYVVAVRPPQLTSLQAERINSVGDQVNLPVPAQSPDEGSLSYAATGLPKGLSISASTGLITGQIQPDGLKTRYTPLITVTNQKGSASATSTMSLIWWVQTGAALLRVNCGGGSSSALDGGMDWADDGNTTSLYRTPLADDSNRELAGTYRGEEMPPWWPINVLGRWRFSQQAAGITYVLPVDTTDPVAVHIGLRGVTEGPFDVLIQDSTVLASMDSIIAYRVAGTGIRSFMATPDAQQNITVKLIPVGAGTAQIAGLEVAALSFSENPPPGSPANSIMRLIAQRRTYRRRAR